MRVHLWREKTEFKNHFSPFIGFPVYRSGSFSAEFFGGWAHYPGEGRKSRAGVGDVLPLAGLRLQFRQVFVNFIPSDGVVTDGIVSFGIRVPLKRR